MRGIDAAMKAANPIVRMRERQDAEFAAWVEELRAALRNERTPRVGRVGGAK